MGFDYKFGHHRTDADYLARNFSGNVHVIEEQQSDGEKISSNTCTSIDTKVRLKKPINFLATNSRHVESWYMVMHVDVPLVSNC